MQMRIRTIRKKKGKKKIETEKRYNRVQKIKTEKADQAFVRYGLHLII